MNGSTSESGCTEDVPLAHYGEVSTYGAFRDVTERVFVRCIIVALGICGFRSAILDSSIIRLVSLYCMQRWLIVTGAWVPQEGKGHVAVANNDQVSGQGETFWPWKFTPA